MSHFLALTAALSISLSLPAFSAGANHSLQSRAFSAARNVFSIAESRKTAKQLGGKLGGKLTDTGVSELSAQDCKNVGGKVIDVTDNRCGASRKYCRMPDTNAVCIDIVR